MQLGNPSGVTANTNNHTHYLIQRTIEALDYNDTLGEANWASWDLTTNDANGAVPRQDSFAADTNLPSGFFIVNNNAYASSGYDRGHLCDSADRTDSTNDNNLTFLMSNMMPQAPDNNRVTWGNFEDYCRTLAQTNELLIICGPSGFTGAKINTNGYVSIPSYTWKIVVVTSPGTGAATNRIAATNRVITIRVPNTNGVNSAWQTYITSAAQIEVDTGFTFFTALPTNVAAALRAKVDGQTNPPPVIFAFSPTNGAAGTNVVITGTNFNSATAVTFNGAGASFTLNSSNQITAVVPTNASSGFISVTTPSGTAVSAGSFTVFGGGGGTVYNGVLAGWDVSALPGGSGNFGPSPYATTTNAPNLAVVGLTRGAGVKTTGTATSGAWGGDGFIATNAASAIVSNQFVTFSLIVSNGYKVSYTAISRFDYRRSSTAPTNGLLQFQVGSGAFTDIINVFYTNTSTTGASLAAIDLSGFGALQNVGAGTNVTFRIVDWGGTSSAGTWYVYDVANSTALDLAVQGTVTQVLTATNPPGIQAISFAGGNFSLTITGAVATSYTITAATNLVNPNWVTLLTTNPGTLPFTFVDTNRLMQRFYRVQNP